MKDWYAKHGDDSNLPLPYPFVLKNDQGGCGFGIFLVANNQDLQHALCFLKKQGGRFVIQQYVDHGGKDLRVVMVGDQVHTYWRCQETPGEFRNNVGRGASIDPKGDPALTTAGVDCVLKLKRLSGINLAAVDIMFDKKEKKPLISEINFVFGRKGVGGTPAFRKLFETAARDWLKSLGLNQPI
ncbi:MAG: hypothetical protein JEZ02_03755 [Desulfatibacillum sp.]|nr:hypothetical protein [Desulfatibacillum sp.]